MSGNRHADATSNIDTASEEEPTLLDVADMVCVGTDMFACLPFFWEKIPDTTPTLPTKVGVIPHQIKAYLLHTFDCIHVGNGSVSD
jgi:hypothetical protein